MNRILKLFCWIPLTLCSVSFAETCQFSSPPQVLRDDDFLLQIWPDADTNLLTLPAQNLRMLDQFRTAISELIHPEQMGLLRRQREIFSANGAEGARRFDLLLTGSVGRIKKNNCLEALLHNTHLERWSEAARQAEFQALVLRNDKTDRLRVYFLSGTEIGPPPLDPIYKFLHQDLQQGWRLFTHLHNHPFFFSNPTGDIAGTTIPSDGDVGEYQRLQRLYGLQRAWITNGFDTLHLASEDFDRL